MKAGLADCKGAMKGVGVTFPLGFVGTSDLIVIGLVSVYILFNLLSFRHLTSHNFSYTAAEYLHIATTDIHRNILTIDVVFKRICDFFLNRTYLMVFDDV